MKRAMPRGKRKRTVMRPKRWGYLSRAISASAGLKTFFIFPSRIHASYRTEAEVGGTGWCKAGYRRMVQRELNAIAPVLQIHSRPRRAQALCIVQSAHCASEIGTWY